MPRLTQKIWLFCACSGMVSCIGPDQKTKTAHIYLAIITSTRGIFLHYTDAVGGFLDSRYQNKPIFFKGEITWKLIMPVVLDSARITLPFPG